VQWATRPHCRRCGVLLPQPVINLVEVEKPVPVVQKEILEVPVIREITIPIDRPCLRCALNQTTPSSANSEFPTIEQMERSLIEAALDRCHGDRLKAAAMLGIGKTTIIGSLRVESGQVYAFCNVILNPVAVPPFLRIYLDAIKQHAEVDMVASGHSRLAARAHDLASLHHVALVHINMA